MSVIKKAAWLAFGLAFGLAAAASANERHFTRVYESAVLPEGAREVETWSTPRWGRDAFYVAFDYRLELEAGVTERLQTALYLNATVENAQSGQSSRLGLSSEWKYRLLDPVADAVGLALYGELTVTTAELELEGKVIVDKRLGDLLVAANVVGEYDVELAPGAIATDGLLQLDLGATYLLGRGFGVGVELENDTRFSADQGYESSTLIGGPVLTYAARGWWIAASFGPQLFAAKSTTFAAQYPGPLQLHDNERYQARVLFSFHL